LCNCRNSTFRTYYRFNHCVLFKHLVSTRLFARLAPASLRLYRRLFLFPKKQAFSGALSFGLLTLNKRAYLVYHSFFLLSSTFFNFFQKFFQNRSIPCPPQATALLYYHTFSSLSIPFLKFFSKKFIFLISSLITYK